MNKPIAWMDDLSFFTKKPEDMEGVIPLYTHPVKEQHLSLQKTEDGELVAVTYTDDEHRIVEVLWQKPLVKELTDEEIMDIWNSLFKDFSIDIGMFARAILRKAQEADKIESLGTVNIGGVHYRNGKEVK